VTEEARKGSSKCAEDEGTDSEDGHTTTSEGGKGPDLLKMAGI
jgi:hypothetical protein